MSLVADAESAALGGVSKVSTALSVCFVVLLIGLGAGFIGGWQIHGWYDAKTTAAGEAKALKATAAESTRRAKIGENYVQRKQQIENFYAQDSDWWLRWSNAHPSVAAAGCDIGDDGLRDWNLWNQGPGPYDPAKPAGAVPGNAAAGGKQPVQGSGGQPQGGGADLLRVPGQARGADRGDKG